MRVVLFLLPFLLLSPAAHAQGVVQAEMDTRLEPEAVTVSVEENQTVLLHINGRIQCVPGLPGPRDIQGFLSRHGWSFPGYWRVEPTRLEIPWEERDAGEWVIDEPVPLAIIADTPAPEQYAGEELTQVNLNSAGQFLLPTGQGECSPAGYGWDHQSHELTVNVPIGVEDEAGTNGTVGAGDPGGGWTSAVIALLAIYGALMTLVAIARVRKRR